MTVQHEQPTIFVFTLHCYHRLRPNIRFVQFICVCDGEGGECPSAGILIVIIISLAVNKYQMTDLDIESFNWFAEMTSPKKKLMNILR